MANLLLKELEWLYGFVFFPMLQPLSVLYTVLCLFHWLCISRLLEQGLERTGLLVL